MRAAWRSGALCGVSPGDAEAQGALESEAWDGEWYRRAFYDNGKPLGRSRSEECQIDSIAQSLGRNIGRRRNVARAKQAMQSVEKPLVLEERV